ncbi:hepatocyte cell adhesion molecule-like [Alosa alosa]|uniref:hepatocyte cell adhesion molecule-like n=1 Tax=Alosa alosa TaxID=278164 RepID=UPI0020154D88|nr:hepatocyte cell adhesion molecule-like [Alosa alosa]
MVMGSLMTECISFIFLLLLTHKGVYVGTWNVTYSPTYICALEGSSVTMSCSYTYPSNYKVKEAFWINQDSHIPVDFSKNESFARRVTADCGDKKSQCSLHMTNLTKEDAHYQYYCRIETTVGKQKWIGKPGISVNVTDLRVVSTERTNNVTKGDIITLTCGTTCNLTSRPSFTWSKDGRPVEKKQIINNQLQLHPVSYEDEGNYTCAVGGFEDLQSPPYRLNVKRGQSAVMNVLIAVAVCVAVVVLCAVFWVWFRKKHKESKGELEQLRATHSAALRADAAGGGGPEGDVQYYNINFQSRAAAPPSGAAAAGAPEDDVQYSNIQPHGSTQTAGAQGDDVPYASVQFNGNKATTSHLGQPEDDTSVIYSRVS